MSESRIKLLAISGSPHIASTDFAAKFALRYAGKKNQIESDYVSVHRKTINFCILCHFCVKKKEGCVQKDDVQAIYPKLEWANAWVLASPVYQGQISGQLKAILDRCRAVVAKNPKVFENKVGAAIAVGGDRNGGQDPTLQTIIDFYIINEMIPVGGGSFGANLGATIWSKDKRAKGTEADKEGLRTIHRTVDRMIKVASLIHSRNING